MTRSILFIALILSLAAETRAQLVTGLSEWDLFLDPGHSQTENQGAFGYSEAENVLRVGLALREMLMTETDVDTVYMSRTDDYQIVTLSQRTDHANSVGADFFHSIHSNAAAPHVNHVFVLWAQLRSGSEPAPPFNGGRSMAEIMGPLLADGMRIPASNNGAWGECAFYGTSSCRPESTTPKGSRNWVQSFSMMPSALSEAGFHTNPEQNQLKMNHDWPRLEARAMLWAIYDFHGIARPPVSIATGIISDAETGMPINGATITIEGHTYTTDTYESLFYLYSNDPDQLRNGFYYLEDLPAGPLNVTVEAEDFAVYTGELTLVDDFFTFYDVGLMSTVPPFVVSSQPAPDEQNFRIIDPVVIEFSRPMDRSSVEQAFSIDPAVEGVFAWQDNDRRMIFNHQGLEPETGYTVTIAEGAIGAAGDPLDANGDGEPGGTFTLSFVTGPPDTDPPQLIATSPAFGSTSADVLPVITLTYDELIDHDSVEGLLSLEPWAGGAEVPGSVAIYDVRDLSVVTFFPAAELEPATEYRLVVEPGIADVFGNAIEHTQQLRFTSGSVRWQTTTIDAFEGDFTSNWWDPQQSGSTAGIITDSTYRFIETEVVNELTGSTQSMKIQYGWDLAASGHLIRVHLGSGAPQNVTFEEEGTLQAYVFGDGGGSEFAFSVRDARAASAPVGRSPWYAIDWFGWRLVSWDLEQDPPAVWAGSGEFGPPYRMESLQLRYVPGAEQFGSIYVDDLRLAMPEQVIGTDPVAGSPDAFRLHTNYPNPFSTSTTIRFELESPAQVEATVYNILGAEVARLIDGDFFSVGTHQIEFDAAQLASGTYIVRLSAGSHFGSIRMVIVR